MKTPEFEPGSFRDREARVFVYHDEIYRALSESARENWRLLSSKEFFKRGIETGKIVGTEEAESLPETLGRLSDGWVTALRHERIPFVSYAYEWPFDALREAALLHLDILLEATREDMISKDSSSFNIQWSGTRPVFIDIASFEPLPPGDAWIGYLQFCQLFLFPLLLTAYKDVAFQPWLRGSVDGITPEDMAKIISWRDRFRPGVLTHVLLHSKLQSRASGEVSRTSELRRAGFSNQLIQNNLNGLKKLVEGLSWKKSTSEWSDYAEEHSYSEGDFAAKSEFVRAAAATGSWPLVWDLGCNTGFFSRIAADYADYVVSMDSDHLAVNRLFLELKKSGPSNVLPLVGNLTDPSPALGWRCRERKEIAERGRPDLVLCLALIHHLAIRANVPVPDIVDWLAELGAHLVVEFVTKQDPMVERLLLNKRDNYDDYELDAFRSSLAGRFEILRETELQSGTRVLFFARPR